MAKTNGEIRTLGKISNALETLGPSERRMVLGFLGEPGNGMRPRAEAAVKVARVLADLDETAARRVLAFLHDQLAPVQSST